MKRWAWGLILLLLLVGCVQKETPAPKLMEPVGVSMDAAEVTRGEISVIELAEGAIKPQVEALSFVVDGSLAKMQVTVGEQVQKGQVLATLQEQSQKEAAAALREEIDFLEKDGAYAQEQLELRLRLAELALEQAQGDPALLQLDVEQARLALAHQKQTLELELSQRREKLGKLQEQMARNTLAAPFTGRVVYVAASRPGAPVQAYAPLIYLADDTRLLVESAYLSEGKLLSASRLYARVGDAQYDLTYQPYEWEEYIAIALSGGEMSSRFTLSAPPGAVTAGQYACVVCESNGKRDALRIPANALYRDASGRYVYQVEGGKRTRRAVETGVATDALVEIVSGLKEGDLVYVKE